MTGKRSFGYVKKRDRHVIPAGHPRDDRKKMVGSKTEPTLLTKGCVYISWAKDYFVKGMIVCVCSLSEIATTSLRDILAMTES